MSIRACLALFVALLAAVATPSASAQYKVATSHPRILLSDPATLARLKQVLASNSGAGARFQNQVAGQLLGRRAYAFQPWYAALLYQLTGETRYASFAVEETDKFVAAEEEKISRGQRPAVAGDSYLEIGAYVGNVALVYDWCHAQLTPEQRKRWADYANKSLENVWNHRGASWGGTAHPWTGWSVDNPSNNYYYSFLRATMLVGLATDGENEHARKWLQHFRVTKIENQLVPTFNRDLAGGGSREGTGYGTAMKGLWQLYEWWERSTGERIATRTPHALASMAHLMHSIVPTLDRLAPTGDHARESSAALFDYHREYLLALASLFPQERLSGVARTLLEGSSVPQMKQAFMYWADFILEQPDIAPRPLTELATTYWGAGTGQLMMRSRWDAKDASFANFICGPYSESHAHRDQGSFVVYKGGWLATDANMYSRSGIEQDEELHNLVRFESGGATIKQAYGTSCVLTALAATPQFTYAAARVTPNYKGHPAITKSEREFLFVKPDTFVVFDRAVATNAATRRIWTLNLPAAPKIDGDRISYADGAARLDVLRLAPTGLNAEVRPWVDSGRRGMQAGVRIDVADVGSSAATQFLHVLSAGGAVESAQRADATGSTGAQIKLADGRSVTVRFSNQGSGGSVEIRERDGSSTFSGPLPSSVTAPPLFASP